MTDSQDRDPNEPKDEFLKAAEEDDRGIVAEFVAFMAENKMWWLAPILFVFGLLAVLLVVGTVAPGALPFMYTFW